MSAVPGLSVNADLRTIRFAGVERRLQPQELIVLLELLKPGTDVVPHARLWCALWGDDPNAYPLDPALLIRHRISALRLLLEDLGAPAQLRSVRGSGFALVPIA